MTATAPLARDHEDQAERGPFALAGDFDPDPSNRSYCRAGDVWYIPRDAAHLFVEPTAAPAGLQGRWLSEPAVRPRTSVPLGGDRDVRFLTHEGGELVATDVPSPDAVCYKILSGRRGDTFEVNFKRKGEYLIRVRVIDTNGEEGIKTRRVSVKGPPLVTGIVTPETEEPLPAGKSVQLKAVLGDEVSSADDIDFTWTFRGPVNRPSKAPSERTPIRDETGKSTLTMRFAPRGTYVVEVTAENQLGETTVTEEEFTVGSGTTVEVVEDFERGDLNPYTNGHRTEDSKVVSDIVFDGSHSLKQEFSGTTFTRVLSPEGGELPYYPSRGDDIEVWWNE